MTDPVTAAIIAASVSGSVAIAVALFNTWTAAAREQRARRREHFARALTAVISYKELPYVVHRRDAAGGARESERISTDFRKVQEDIAYYSAWLATESAPVARAYGALVSRLRAIAGGAIREAWTRPGISSDAGMNIEADFGFAELGPLEHGYLDAVRNHLSLLRRVRSWCSFGKASGEKGAMRRLSGASTLVTPRREG